jgi:hypothetical protein
LIKDENIHSKAFSLLYIKGIMVPVGDERMDKIEGYF